MVEPLAPALAPAGRAPARRLPSLLGIGIAIVPALVCLTFIAATSLNVPRGDDYPSILLFLCDWLDAPTLKAKMELLWAPYYSHRIVLTRLVALADFSILGRCNFQVLQGIGWLGWAAVTGGLAFSVDRMRSAPWRALPVFLLLMQPQGFTNLHTAMQAIQNIGVVLLAFIAVTAATSARRSFWWIAVVAAVVGAFTSVNGLLIFVALGVALLAQRRMKDAGLWLVLGALVWVAFFHGFKREAAPFDGVEFLTNFLVMAGGFAQFERLPLSFAMTIGALALALPAVLLAFPATWRRWPSHAAFLLFLLLTIAMAAAGRIGWGAAYMLQDRYRLYGLLIVATLLVLATDAIPESGRWRFTVVAIGSTAVFCLLSYVVTSPLVLTAARWCQVTPMNRQLDAAFAFISTDGWAGAVATLKRAEEGGIYRLPSVLSKEEIAALSRDATVSATPEFVFQPALNDGIQGALLTSTPGTRPPPAVDFAVATVNARPLVLPFDRSRARFVDMPRQRSLFSRHFGFIYPEALYSAGRHPLSGYARDAGGRLRVVWRAVAECPPLADRADR